MFLTKGQIESFALICYKAISNKRFVYVNNVLTGLNNFDDDKCFYRLNAMLGIIWGYNPFVYGVTNVAAPGVTTDSFLMPIPNNTVQVPIDYVDGVPSKQWIAVNTIVYIDGAGFFQIKAVNEGVATILCLPGGAEVSQGTVIPDQSKVFFQSNCLDDFSIVDIMNKLNAELQLNLCLSDLPETNLNG